MSRKATHSSLLAGCGCGCPALCDDSRSSVDVTYLDGSQGLTQSSRRKRDEIGSPEMEIGHDREEIERRRERSRQSVELQAVKLKSDLDAIGRSRSLYDGSQPKSLYDGSNPRSRNHHNPLLTEEAQSQLVLDPPPPPRPASSYPVLPEVRKQMSFDIANPSSKTVFHHLSGRADHYEAFRVVFMNVLHFWRREVGSSLPDEGSTGWMTRLFHEQEIISSYERMYEDRVRNKTVSPSARGGKKLRMPVSYNLEARGDWPPLPDTPFLIPQPVVPFGHDHLPSLFPSVSKGNSNKHKSFSIERPLPPPSPPPSPPSPAGTRDIAADHHVNHDWKNKNAGVRVNTAVGGQKLAKVPLTILKDEVSSEAGLGIHSILNHDGKSQRLSQILPSIAYSTQNLTGSPPRVPKVAATARNGTNGRLLQSDYRDRDNDFSFREDTSSGLKKTSEYVASDRFQSNAINMHGHSLESSPRSQIVDSMPLVRPHVQPVRIPSMVGLVISDQRHHRERITSPKTGDADYYGKTITPVSPLGTPFLATLRRRSTRRNSKEINQENLRDMENSNVLTGDGLSHRLQFEVSVSQPLSAAELPSSHTTGESKELSRPRGMSAAGHIINECIVDKGRMLPVVQNYSMFSYGDGSEEFRDIASSEWKVPPEILSSQVLLHSERQEKNSVVGSRDQSVISSVTEETDSIRNESDLGTSISNRGISSSETTARSSSIHHPNEDLEGRTLGSNSIESQSNRKTLGVGGKILRRRRGFKRRSDINMFSQLNAPEMLDQPLSPLSQPYSPSSFSAESQGSGRAGRVARIQASKAFKDLRNITSAGVAPVGLISPSSCTLPISHPMTFNSHDEMLSLSPTGAIVNTLSPWEAGLSKRSLYDSPTILHSMKHGRKGAREGKRVMLRRQLSYKSQKTSTSEASEGEAMKQSSLNEKKVEKESLEASGKRSIAISKATEKKRSLLLLKKRRKGILFSRLVLPKKESIVLKQKSGQVNVEKGEAPTTGLSLLRFGLVPHDYQASIVPQEETLPQESLLTEQTPELGNSKQPSVALSISTLSSSLTSDPHSRSQETEFDMLSEAPQASQEASFSQQLTVRAIAPPSISIASNSYQQKSFFSPLDASRSVVLGKGSIKGIRSSAGSPFPFGRNIVSRATKRQEPQFQSITAQDPVNATTPSLSGYYLLNQQGAPRSKLKSSTVKVRSRRVIRRVTKDKLLNLNEVCDSKEESRLRDVSGNNEGISEISISGTNMEETMYSVLDGSPDISKPVAKARVDSILKGDQREVLLSLSDISHEGIDEMKASYALQEDESELCKDANNSKSQQSEDLRLNPPIDSLRMDVLPYSPPPKVQHSSSTIVAKIASPQPFAEARQTTKAPVSPSGSLTKRGVLSNSPAGRRRNSSVPMIIGPIGHVKNSEQTIAQTSANYSSFLAPYDHPTLSSNLKTLYVLSSGDRVEQFTPSMLKIEDKFDLNFTSFPASFSRKSSTPNSRWSTLNEISSPLSVLPLLSQNHFGGLKHLTSSGSPQTEAGSQSPYTPSPTGGNQQVRHPNEIAVTKRSGSRISLTNSSGSSGPSIMGMGSLPPLPTPFWQPSISDDAVTPFPYANTNSPNVRSVAEQSVGLSEFPVRSYEKANSEMRGGDLVDSTALGILSHGDQRVAIHHSLNNHDGLANNTTPTDSKDSSESHIVNWLEESDSSLKNQPINEVFFSTSPLFSQSSALIPQIPPRLLLHSKLCALVFAYAYSHELIVAGGRDEDDELDTMEILHIPSMTWKDVRSASLQYPRFGSASVGVGNALVMCGGLGSPSVEVFRKWPSPTGHLARAVTSAGRSVTLPSLHEERFGACGIYVPNYKVIYVFGGVNPDLVRKSTARTYDTCFLETTEVYFLNSPKWIPGPDMLEPRLHASAVAIGSDIYVFGGESPSVVLDTIDVLNIEEGQWRRIKPHSNSKKVNETKNKYCRGYVDTLLEPQPYESSYLMEPEGWEVDPSEDNISSKSSSYALPMIQSGLYNDSGMEFQHLSAQKLKHESKVKFMSVYRQSSRLSDTFSTYVRMPGPRSGASVIASDHLILMLGGRNAFKEITKSFYVFDTQTFLWHQMPDMLTPREFASATMRDGRIYIIGGSDGKNVLKSGEVFHVETNAWTYLPSMGASRYGAHALFLEL